MLRRAVPVLAVFALLVAVTPVDAKRTKKPEQAPSVPAAPKAAAPAKVEPLDVQALVEQAEELWHVKKDHDGAWEKFNAAVDADPKNWDVRLQRGFFFEVVASIVVPEEKQKFRDLAREDFAKISNAEPDSMLGGIARDGLTRLSGKTLIEGASVTCPPEANAAHERAESFYGAQRFDEAAAEYEKAVAGCPTSAVIWTNYADVYYLQGQYAKAKELFVKALAIDPWNRSAHRFLGDTEVKLENLGAAVNQLELAVISDPVYEAAWSGLRTYASHMGRNWKRVYGQKTVVTKGPDKDGKQEVTIAVTPETKPDAKDIDASVWMGYGLSKAGLFSGTAFDTDPSGKLVERKVNPETMSALEIERESVKSALLMAREMDAKVGDKPGSFWSMMARAEGAGFLDEAIFLHMLDAPLAAEYPAFREKHSGRLVTYLDTMIVP